MKVGAIEYSILSYHRRVKGYIVFAGKYVTGKDFRFYKVYIINGYIYIIHKY